VTYAMIAFSLVLLTGWVGQISLAQAAFVGIGAFSSVQLASRMGVAFPFTLPLAAAVASAAAVALGAVALRVRGLYLAVATLIVGWMADEYLFGASWFVGSGGSATARTHPIGIRGGFPYFDLTDRRTFYVVALAGALLAYAVLANLRASKSGRAFFAVRGSEVAAASLGIDVTHTKLVAFGLSGAIAGLGGALIASGQQTIVPQQFALGASLVAVAIAVVGGLDSLGGAVGASVLFALLNELIFRVDALHGYLEVVSSALLALALLFYPGGLAAIPRAIGRFAERTGAARRPSVVRMHQVRRDLGQAAAWTGAQLKAFVADISAAGRGLRSRIIRTKEFPAPAEVSRNGNKRSQGGIALSVQGLDVAFGGVKAAEDVSFEVREGEIAGLIGPNGAGKTTVFNVIAGFVQPDVGRVEFFGSDISALAPHERARRGISRTFQAVQLLGDLSVRDNLLVATHSQDPTGFFSHAIASGASADSEERSRARVAEVAAALGLEEILDRPASDLPFGTLRDVELARALVSGAPLVMLDEPASGLDTTETRRLGERLREIRDTLGVSILLIEHDVGLVLTICDRVTVLDAGRVIAHGTASEIRDHPEVAAAYFGATPSLV